MTPEKRVKKAHIQSKYGDKRFVDPEAHEAHTRLCVLLIARSQDSASSEVALKGLPCHFVLFHSTKIIIVPCKY